MSKRSNWPAATQLKALPDYASGVLGQGVAGIGVRIHGVKVKARIAACKGVIPSC